MIRRFIKQNPPIKSLFDAQMLLQALRRHFQPFDINLFESIALHFLDYCSLLDGMDTLDLKANVVESLKESLRDRLDEDSDPTAAHCRYTMVIDPSDSETAVDLLFNMNLLEEGYASRVITLSEFPDDNNPTRHTAILGQIKLSIERGDCLILVNSRAIQSALYDVINRHYVTAVSTNPITGKTVKEYYAQISVGSFSRPVRVHPNFRLIVHVPESSLPVTPLPFLNRMEKFRISVADALRQRIQKFKLSPPPCFKSLPEISYIDDLSSILQRGVEGFVQFCGGESSFYSMAVKETIPAFLLAQFDNDHVNNSDFRIHPSLLTRLMQNKLRADKQNELHVTQQSNENMEDDVNSLDEDNIELDNPNEPSFYDSSTTVMHRLGELIRDINYHALETARVESIFYLRQRLPISYLKEYLLNQQHFSVVEMMKLLLENTEVVNLENSFIAENLPPVKLVAYTRTGNK
jgi:hypothetical protein